MEEMGVPGRDPWDLPTSPLTFPDGAHYRIEIAGVERPSTLKAMIHEANKRKIVVHRAIYQATSALAIVHTHPPYAIAQSLVKDEIVPVDSEGSYLLHKVPVVAAQLTAGSTEVAGLLPAWLKEYDIVMLRGHGPFAIGHLLEEAYQLTSVLEMACRILTVAEGMGAELKEYRKGSEQYDSW